MTNVNSCVPICTADLNAIYYVYMCRCYTVSAEGCCNAALSKLCECYPNAPHTVNRLARRYPVPLARIMFVKVLSPAPRQCKLWCCSNYAH